MSDLIAILGAGNGGHTLAADLTIRGFDVNLFELPQFSKNLKKVLDNKKISIEGLINGEVTLNKATTNIRAALEDAKIILVSVPSYGQKTIAELCSTHIKENQTILVFAANLGSIEFANILRKYGKDNIIAETNTLPYGCRLVEQAKVNLSILTDKVYAGVFPSRETRDTINYLQELFPCIRPVKTVLEAALNNPNPLIHPTGMLLNAGKVESNEDFSFYDHLTPAIREIIKAKDKERCLIGKNLDYNLVKYDEFGEEFIHNGSLAKFKAPKTLTDRYLTEDVPYGLVLWSSVAKQLNLRTPIIDAEIALTSSIHKVDYMDVGRNLKNLKFNLKSV